MRRAIALFSTLILLAACDDDTHNTANTNNTNTSTTTVNNTTGTNNPNPCATVRCQEHSSCVVELGSARCVCDTGFDLVGERCQNTQTVPCVDDAPPNASSLSALVEITFSEGVWSDPAPCDWECDAGFEQQLDQCIIQAETPLPGFGTITGTCGPIDTSHLQSPDNFVFINTIDFGTDPYDASDYEHLSLGGQTIADTPNAGGSSQWSEVFSYELLYRCELAQLLKTETEILYDTEGAITDLLVSINTLKVGVSVTRAMSWPRDTPYSPTQALDLLEGKLEDIQESSQNVAAADAWEKQILHVITDRVEHISVLQDALNTIDVALLGDTIVLLSVTEGQDDFIYTNQI